VKKAGQVGKSSANGSGSVAEILGGNSTKRVGIDLKFSENTENNQNYG
jgi:hypothetical protein